METVRGEDHLRKEVVDGVVVLRHLALLHAQLCLLASDLACQILHYLGGFLILRPVQVWRAYSNNLAQI